MVKLIMFKSFIYFMVILVALTFLLGGGEHFEARTMYAYVSGYIGPQDGFYGSARIPKKIDGINCYFVTNLELVAAEATAAGWKAKLVPTPTDQSYLGCSMASKRLKVFPQSFVDGDYDFVIWFDNKFDPEPLEVRDILNTWNPTKAAAMHRHPFLSDQDGLGSVHREFEASMAQDRYNKEKEHYQAYILSQINAGYHAEGYRHFTTCFIIYNMHHTDTIKIQETWWEHIKECGIQCQISMYFVAQRFRDTITEFVGGGKCGG